MRSLFSKNIDGKSFVSKSRKEELKLNVLAIGIGVVAGLGAVFFRLVIWMIQEIFYGRSLNPGNVEFNIFIAPNLFDSLVYLGDLRFVLLPAIGGLLVGIIIYFTTKKVKGHGVPEVLEAILVRSGRINPKISFYKIITSGIAIASGGALGREGPIIQIGSGVGSFFGKFVELKRVRTLVAAGAAAGLAATFNAPLAGVIFAIEIILNENYLIHVVSIVLSTATATAIARSLLAFTPAPGIREFLVPTKYNMISPSLEFPLYILLGLIIAVVGSILIKSLYGVERFFQKLDLPNYIKPSIGAALLGISVLITAMIFNVSSLQSAEWLFGVGYRTIHSAISSGFTFLLLIALAVMKVIGFSLSVGSGSSGGIFSPTLFVGAMVGGAFGLAVNKIFTNIAGSGAFALVSMGGAFAAAAGAPLTATFIIFELTGQYTIILPLLIVTVLGSEITNHFMPGGTIYTQKLRDKGLTLYKRREGKIENLIAKDIMTKHVDTIKTSSSIKEALELFRATEHHGIPLVDKDNHLKGIVVQSDLQEFLKDHARSIIKERKESLRLNSDVNIEEIASHDVITSSPRENLLQVVDKMEESDIGRIPIVNEEKIIVGIITRSDILDAYEKLSI